MLTKKQVLQTIEALPDEFSAEDLIDQVILLQKIEQAQQEIKDGKGMTTLEVEKRVGRMAKLIWAPSASGDLKKIGIYIANDSVKAAKAQVASLIQRAKILEKFPEMGRPVPELKDVQFRQILEGRYRIIYQLTNNEVHILTVHHQSMLLRNNPVIKPILKGNE